MSLAAAPTSCTISDLVATRKTNTKWRLDYYRERLLLPRDSCAKSGATPSSVGLLVFVWFQVTGLGAPRTGESTAFSIPQKCAPFLMYPARRQ